MTTQTVKPGETPRVLVADDDITARLLAQQALERHGFTVALAEDGLEALSVFQEQPPHIVLMDVDMPRLDGFDACRRLRSLPCGRTVPILMVTGRGDIESIEQAYEAGATDFAPKPINWLILSHRVRYMLRASAALQALHKSEERLANAQRIARLGNWEWDLESHEASWSEQLYRILDLSPNSSAPTLDTFLGRVHPDDREQLRRWFSQTCRTRMPVSFSHRIVVPPDQERIVQQQVEVHCDDASNALVMSGTVQDVTELWSAKKEIQTMQHLAYFDSLTGVANRRLFKEQICQALELAARHDRLAAVLFLDLDDFKRINDTLGHGVGDLLLKEVADRLLYSVRNTDVVSRGHGWDPHHRVARLGGDEFTVLLTELHQASDAAAVAQRILAALNAATTLAGQEVIVTPSIGIAVFPCDGHDADTLIENADAAMYQAKKSGKNLYRFFGECRSMAALKQLEPGSQPA